MFTVHGVFGEYNTIITDDGKKYIAYPYGIDFPRVFMQSGFFLLCPFQDESLQGEYIITNYLLDSN